MTLRQMTESYDLTVKWCDLYVESALFEEEVGETVFTEKQEYPDRSIAGIPFRIIDAIKKLFKKLKDYIAGVIDKIKLIGVEKKVKQLEEMKKDPEIASIKVKVEDPQEQQKRLKEYKKECDNIRKKIKKREKITDDDKSKLQKAKEWCQSPAGELTISAVILAAGLGAAITDTKINQLAREVANTEAYYDACIDTVDRAGVGATKGRGEDLYFLTRAEGEYSKMNALMKIKNANLFNRIFTNLARRRTDYKYSEPINRKNLKDKEDAKDKALYDFNDKYQPKGHTFTT